MKSATRGHPTGPGFRSGKSSTRRRGHDQRQITQERIGTRNENAEPHRSTGLAKRDRGGSGVSSEVSLSTERRTLKHRSWLGKSQDSSSKQPNRPPRFCPFIGG